MAELTESIDDEGWLDVWRVATHYGGATASMDIAAETAETAERHARDIVHSALVHTEHLAAWIIKCEVEPATDGSKD
jgi:hypothetical protein